MAIKQIDHPNYKDPNRYSAHFGKARETALPKALKAGTVGAGILTAIFTSYNVVGTTPVPEIDHQLTTGLFEQTQHYSYYDLAQNGALNGYMVVQHDEGYALYENMQNETRLKFVQDEDLAIERIDSIVTALQATLDQTIINAATEDPFEERSTGRLFTCSHISQPYDYNGGIERYIAQADNGARGECDIMQGVNMQRQDDLNTHLTMWQDTRDAIITQNGDYGVDTDRMTEAKVESHLEIVAENTAMALAGGAMLWLLGTGMVAGRRQRTALKLNK